MTLYIKYSLNHKNYRKTAKLVDKKEGYTNGNINYNYLEICDKIIFDYWLIDYIFNNESDYGYLKVNESKYNTMKILLNIQNIINNDNTEIGKLLEINNMVADEMIKVLT
jgi:hypothetical protein